MGALAEASKKLLSLDMLKRVIDAKGDSLDDACLLAKQMHLERTDAGLLNYA
jgi:hypothetical protein